MNNSNICNKKRLSEYAYEFFLSDRIEGFFFSVVCATIFTASMFHWRLDIDHNLSVRDGVLIENMLDFGHIFWVEVIVAIYYIIRKYLQDIKFHFDAALTMLICAMLLVAVLDYHREDYLNVQYAWLLPMAYIIGKVVLTTNPLIINDRLEKMFFSLAFGIFIASAMDFYNNFRLAYYYKVLSTEFWMSFWVWSEESRCTYELGFVLLTASFGYMIYKSRKHICGIILILIVNVLIQYCDIVVEGRENRLLIVINVVLFSLLFLYDRWTFFSEKIRKIVKRTVLIIGALIVLLVLAFIFNICGFYDRYLASNWSAGGGVLTNVRFLVDYSAFKLMLKYPTENYANYTNVYDYYYQSHSMLLEYGRLNGFTVYLALVLFRLIIIKDAIILAFKKNANSWVKYFLIPGFVSINMYYSMEPNGYAHRYFWMIGLLISGMIRGWNEVNDKCMK
jgi:hypothetical protein